MSCEKDISDISNAETLSIYVKDEIILGYNCVSLDTPDLIEVKHEPKSEKEDPVNLQIFYIDKRNTKIQNEMKIEIGETEIKSELHVSDVEYNTSKKCNRNDNTNTALSEVKSHSKELTESQSKDLDRLASHTGKLHICPTCDYVTKYARSLKIHMRTHTGKKPCKCSICDFAGSQISDLTRHMLQHTGRKPHKCSICQYATTRAYQLKSHMRLHKGDIQSMTENAISIEVPMGEDESMNIVNDSEKKLFKCTVCGYATNRSFNLKKHMYKHTGEKSHKCDICDYAFTSSYDLKKHMRTHTGEKPYKCDICDYAGNLSYALKTHMLKHTGEKPYRCTECEYAAAEPCYLKYHMQTHTGEKSFKCNECDYSAYNLPYLRKHMRKHTGERPYKCTICKYTAAQSNSLKSHMRVHTGEKPFKCITCDYATTNSSNLRKHNFQKHTV